MAPHRLGWGAVTAKSGRGGKMVRGSWWGPLPPAKDPGPPARDPGPPTKDRSKMSHEGKIAGYSQPSTDGAREATDALPEVPGALSEQDKSGRLAALTDLIEMVRPVINQDGGDLVLVSADVETGYVELQLQGACSSCAVSSTTLQAGVERILKERLPWVTEVSGGVDESIDWEESAAMGRGGYVPQW